MRDYQFTGIEPRFYPMWEGKSFTANQGDVMAFDVPPTDGLWVIAAAPVTKKSARAETPQENTK